MADQLAVDEIPTADAHAALTLLAERQSDPDRGEELRNAFAELTHGACQEGGLLQARREGRLVGAIGVWLTGGRAALLWPPQLVDSEGKETGEVLAEHAERWLGSKNVHLVQATLPLDHGPDAEWLREHRFSGRVDLLYMGCSSDHFPSEMPRSDCRLVPYRAVDRQRLGRLIERTYQDTLDCPELNGMRDVDDVLDGYERTGEFDPSRWSFLQIREGQGDAEAEDVGCLLLAAHPRHRNWELVYLGLVPSARGYGWGLAATRQAQWQAARAGCHHMVLAVDAENRPAIATYAAAGFQAWDRRCVFLKRL